MRLVRTLAALALVLTLSTPTQAAPRADDPDLEAEPPASDDDGAEGDDAPGDDEPEAPVEAPVEAPAEPTEAAPVTDPATERAMNRARELRLKGQERASQGLWDLALEAYQQALEAYPAYPLAHNEVGVVLVEMGQLARAEASFREALALAPGFTSARANLGEVLRRLNRLDEARAELERAVGEAPEDATVHFALAAVYARKEMKPQALWAMERYLELATPDEGAYAEVRRRAADLIRDGVVAEAPASVTTEDVAVEPIVEPPVDDVAVVTRPGEPGALARHTGDAAFYAQRYMQALDAYRAEADKAPDDVVLMYKIGATLAVMRDHRGAERWWRKALLADPRRELLYYHLALLRAKRDEAAPTTADLPADPVAAARAALYQGRAAEALVLLADQPGIESATLRGEGLLMLGRYEEARAQLELVLKERPEDPDATGALAEALLALGETARGKAAMTDWLEERQADPDTFIVMRSRDRASRLVTPVDDLDE